MNAPTKFNVWYCSTRVETFPTLKEAQDCITKHPSYKKSLFNKKGYANSKNPNDKENFLICDNNGDTWYIK